MIQHFKPGFQHLEDIKVEPLDKEAIIKEINSLDEKLVQAKDGEEAVKVVKEYFALNDDLQTAVCLINIRYTVNTKDEYYLITAHDDEDEDSMNDTNNNTEDENLHAI